MSKGNDPESAAGMALFAGIALISVFLLFVAALLCVVLTIICILAWNEERDIFGHRFTPVAARGFIAWGIVGAIVVGLFGLLMNAGDVLLDRNVPWMPHIGYVLGSMGWATYYAENEADIEARAYERECARNGGTIVQQLKAERLAQDAAASPAPVEVKPAFQFADWNDEELHG